MVASSQRCPAAWWPAIAAGAEKHVIAQNVPATGKAVMRVRTNKAMRSRALTALV